MWNCFKCVQAASWGYLLAKLSDPRATGHMNTSIALVGRVFITGGGGPGLGEPRYSWELACPALRFSSLGASG